MAPSEAANNPTSPNNGIQGSDDLLSQAMDAFTLPKGASDGIGPSSLPPAMAAMRGKTTEEILADLNKSPLFMTDLEEDNDDLEALKALAYEGTPLEVSLGFKERGNECFKEGAWADSKEFYTKAIQVLQAEQRKRAAASKPLSIPNPDNNEVAEELALLEACLVNRAACHLSLKNYRSCTLDCAAALRLNPHNVKAYYRSSKALLALHKLPEADDVCARGLALDPTNQALKQIASQLITQHTHAQAKAQKALETQQRTMREATLLRAALLARGIRTRATPQPPEMEGARVRLLPDAGDATSALAFPTVVLYPLRLQSDFVTDFLETETLAERLGGVLAERPPWDEVGEYTLLGVECYMETVSGGLVKVGKKASLLKVLGGGKVEVVDGLVRIFVLPKAKAEAWVADYKMKKAVEKKAG